MIGIIEDKLNDIPSLIIADTAKETEALPTAVFFHGFTSAKEHNLPIAYMLAEKGFRVILPDSMHHGSREQGINSMARMVSFWDIVMENVKELGMIKKSLDERNLILDGRIGVAGTSMGGITTSAALTQYPWIKTAAILMGSPKLGIFAKSLIEGLKKKGDLPVTDETINQLYHQLNHFDLSLQPEKLKQRPLFFWHGVNDPAVPFDHSYSFYQDAKKLYENQDNVHFVREENRGHKVSRYATLEAVEWLHKHI
ncbi:prolyl oligopeptidase family serine peptidase [Oceanobacillus manasiensis]|uniref:prolyl oligopeptidase family serine peptidase n=1 Tax=Oceanobacillus manasiensis TaxID=586413 RepID=UPI0005A86E56|nr:prolyl oligopeptidase family serine peptidase [Oceanobacillus manasiensis]